MRAMDVSATCSCGCTAPHIVATRRTADGLRVCLWSTGDFTDGAGYRLRRVRDMDVAHVALGDVALETWTTLPELLSAAAQVARSTVRGAPEVRRAIDRVRRIGHVRPGSYYSASIGADGIVRVGKEHRS